MFEKKEICSCRNILDGSIEYIYRYFLIEDIKSVIINGQRVDVPSYGIEISRELILNGKTADLYGERLDSISSTMGKVLELIEYLKDNEVSPIHLVDIVGEKADEWVADFEEAAKSLLKSMALA